MRTIAYLTAVIAGLVVAQCLCSCTTVSEKITAPDGTVTERTTQSVDGAAFTAGANAATAIATARVHADK